MKENQWRPPEVDQTGYNPDDHYFRNKEEIADLAQLAHKYKAEINLNEFNKLKEKFATMDVLSFIEICFNKLERKIKQLDELGLPKKRLDIHDVNSLKGSL